MFDKTERFYIDGAFIPASGPRRLDLVTPSRAGEVVAKVAIAEPHEVERAVSAAKAAFPAWSATTVAERKAALERIVAAYQNRKNELAEAMSMEMGAPVSLARGAQYGAGLGHLTDFARSIEQVQWREVRGEGDAWVLRREPVGVAVLITPWNWPLNQIALKVGAALAAGCTMVLKPSENAPLSAQIFAEAVHEAGLPKGVFNLVQGDGVGVGRMLSEHPDVDLVSLTGSTRAGGEVMRSGAAGIKRIKLELGGKGANIVFADCDVRAAVRHGAQVMFRNTGQSCNAPSRLLVERGALADAVDEARKAAEAVRVGDPASQDTQMGPLVNETQFRRVVGLIRRGVEEGARLVAGGAEPIVGLADGFYVRPTVFADVDNDMTVAREEIFGPVMCIIPFDTEEEAVAIANDTPYGLAAYCSTSDPERIARLARQLRSGMVRFNGTDLPFGSPFGGYKQSGIGREGGIWGIEDFLEIKAVSGALA